MSTIAEHENEALVARKRALRGVVLARREAMSASDRHAASVTIIDKVQALPAYRSATRVLMYMGFGTELETAGLFEAARREGKIVALPRVDKAARALKLHRVDSLDELGEGVWGIREPRDHAPLIAVRDIDFVLVPGVAFDRRGHRLGYGAGFYDRLLVDCAPTAARVVGAFACQLVDDIPVGPHDQAIHRILTENESIECP